MQAQETILFVSVVVLATALIIVLVGPRLRAAKRGGARAVAPGQKVSDSGAVPIITGARARTMTGTEATATAGTPGSAGSPPAPPVLQMICPTCRRRYATGVRYCPFDARVLTADLPQPGRAVPSPTLSSANAGKICPTCSRRYETIAIVCGRDGTALVSVN